MAQNTLTSIQTISAFTIGMGVGAVVFRLFSSRKGQNFLMSCSCKKSHQIYCQKHDTKLLLSLSENLPTYNVMLRLGIELGVNPNVIKACRSITDAVFDILYHKWYKTQDGLGKRSQGLKELERTLTAPTVGQNILISSVINHHFSSHLDHGQPPWTTTIDLDNRQPALLTAKSMTTTIDLDNR